jgi:beta-glucosidase
VNIKGYSVWSLMDLYEIFGGYKAHFGLIRVDFRDPRRQRQLRSLSAYWYSNFLNNRAVVEVDNAATYHAQL